MLPSSSKMLRLVILRSGSSTILQPCSIPVIHAIKSQRYSSNAGEVVNSDSISPSSSSSTISEMDAVIKALDAKKVDESTEGRKATISKAMHAYLKRAKENQEFMDKQEKEFVFGRRHLANMMGKDPENFTQKDIDEAIRYLFPSSLSVREARPMMRPPTEIYPKQKAAQFDMSGRPHHPFFYTAKPNFYFLLHEMVGKLNSLNQLASSRSDADLTSDSSLAGSVWMSKDHLEDRLMEKLNDQMYNEFLTCMERLACHPKKEKEIDFIKSYRTPLSVQGKKDNLPPVTIEPDGRKSAHVPLCMKKSARADVLVTVPGTGEFKINGKGLDYFRDIKARSTVISPLQLVGWLGTCDVEANTLGGYSPAMERKFGRKYCEETWGEMCRAVCVRYGIATALAALGADHEKLRLAGYLTHDRRLNERKKPGRVGPRARWTWKKR